MASVKFLLNRPKSEKPTSILVRFHSKQTKSITLSTGEMVLPSHWDGARVTSKDRKQYDRKNKRLTEIEQQLWDMWRDNRNAAGDVLTDLVKKIVKGEASAEKKTVVQAVRLFIAQYEREKEKTTAGRYKVLLHKLESFNPNLTFHDLDQNFYDSFKQWLYGNNNPLYHGYHIDFDRASGIYTMSPGADPLHPVGLFDDVVFKYLVNLQTVIRWAEKRGYEVNQSYKSWEIIKRSYKPISLTLDELERVESISLPPHLDVARDYLSLECRTGQRISDIKRFNKIQVQDSVWIFTPKKGNRTSTKTVNLPLEGYSYPALMILEKYNYQLPKISEQNLNYAIKEVCKRAGIDEEIFIERWQGNKRIQIPGKKYEFLSTHSGKKTFITILANEGVPLLTISQLTQTSVRTIEKHYLGLIDVKNVAAQLRKVNTKYSPLRKAN